MARSRKKKARAAAAQPKTATTATFPDRAGPSGWFVRPLVGNCLTIGAGVALQFVIILLPLVGPAGSQTVHARANAVSWLAVLALAGTLSGLAWWSKMQRRRLESGPFPWWSTGLLSLSGLFLLAFMTGLLRG